MKTEILFCEKCHTYTMNKVCPRCDSKTITPKPAKFSIDDKYGKYRRMLKLENEMGD